MCRVLVTFFAGNRVVLGVCLDENPLRAEVNLVESLIKNFGTDYLVTEIPAADPTFDGKVDITSSGARMKHRMENWSDHAST